MWGVELEAIAVNPSERPPPASLRSLRGAEGLGQDKSLIPIRESDVVDAKAPYSAFLKQILLI